MGLRSFFVAVFLFGLTISTACAGRGTAEVNRPVSDNLASYWTCAVRFQTDGRGANANEGFEFVPWFETRLRERGVFEPLGRDEQNDAEVNVRVESKTGNNRVTLRVQLFDAKNNDSLGDVEALAPIEDLPAGAQEFDESKRTTALHKAGEAVLALLLEKRKESASKPHPKPAPPLPDSDPVGPSAVCSTQCQPTAASASTFDEQHRVGLGINETMKALRGCLDRVGAQLVEPVVLLRFSPDGQLHHMRVDVGGYEQNDCIRNVRTRIPATVHASRASILRCEYHCSAS